MQSLWDSAVYVCQQLLLVFPELFLAQLDEVLLCQWFVAEPALDGLIVRPPSTNAIPNEPAASFPALIELLVVLLQELGHLDRLLLV